MIRDTELMIENLQHNLQQLAILCKELQEENDKLRHELDEANDLLQDSYRYEDDQDTVIAEATCRNEELVKENISLSFKNNSLNSRIEELEKENTSLSLRNMTLLHDLTVEKEMREKENAEFVRVITNMKRGAE